MFRDELEFDLLTFGKLEFFENSIFENLWVTGEFETGLLFFKMEVVDFFVSVGVIIRGSTCVGVVGVTDVVNWTGCVGGGGVWKGLSDTFFWLVNETSFLKLISSIEGWTIRIFGGRSSAPPFSQESILSPSDWLVSNDDDFWFDEEPDSLPDSERNEPDVEAPFRDSWTRFQYFWPDWTSFGRSVNPCLHQE